MKQDALDMVYIQVSNRIKSKEVLTEVAEAIAETRKVFAGKQYIRCDHPQIREAYTLWMQQKHTDKTMKEIYQYIADQIGTISASRIEVYVSQFIKGYNPHECFVEV